eukprot:TRINITY_DN3168_c0_g1_i1.p1 TRINITY_DN3168_c0_g1~~TRINITY_DN3168_c0_g1_i1.p1  ORF type:complete len:560 (-),score=98.35 TRINITY_DN3168_c0_g1_i1:24-1703(-)
MYLYLLLVVALATSYRSDAKGIQIIKENAVDFNLDSLKGAITCDICLVAVELAETLLEANVSEDEFSKAFTKLCITFNLANSVVCEGMIEEFTPTAIPIFTGIVVRPGAVCDRLHFCKDEEAVTNKEPIDEKTAAQLDKLHKLATSRTDQTLKPLPKQAGTGWFLQLSDIHLDSLYEEGTNNDCGYPVCCRAEYGAGNAGKWGDYNCDPPYRTVQNIFTVLTKFFDPDFVIYTGDSTPHSVWQQSEDEILRNILNVSTMMSEAFPNVPIFPTIGNHDTFPIDQYNDHPIDLTHHDDFRWLKDGLVEAWGAYLPESALGTVRERGYYSALAKPGLRIVSINTQWADGNNLYLLLNDNQEKNQTDWLVETLDESRANGEKVYLIAHIPPASANPNTSYAVDIVEIFTNYSDVIVAHFYGHTHEDQFEVITNSKGDPLDVVYVAPSVTTFSMRNPTFRFYKYDTTTYEILDYNQYYANLTAANEPGQKLQWMLEYSALSEYDLPDMSAASWLDLANRIGSDESVWQKWWMNFNTQIPTPCEEECQKYYVCEMLHFNPASCSG